MLLLVLCLNNNNNKNNNNNNNNNNNKHSYPCCCLYSAFSASSPHPLCWDMSKGFYGQIFVYAHHRPESLPTHVILRLHAFHIQFETLCLFGIWSSTLNCRIVIRISFPISGVVSLLSMTPAQFLGSSEVNQRDINICSAAALIAECKWIQRSVHFETIVSCPYPNPKYCET